MFGRKREVLDPHELGARRSDPTLAALDPLPPDPRVRTTAKKLMLYFAMGVVVVALIRDGVGRPGPAAPGSCTTAAFTLDKAEVKSYGVLRWSATGPADAQVVIAVDTSVVPSSVADGLLAGPVGLRDCKASGRFGMAAAAGDHVLTVFLVPADGPATVLATKKVLVNPE